MIGRIVAGLLAVIMLTLLPLKMKAVHEAQRMENAIRSALKSAYEDIMADRSIDKEKWEKMINGINAAGVPLRVSITVGSLLIGRNGKTFRCIYTDEILEEISEKGNAVDVRGKLVSISAEPVYEDRIVSIANMFWVSYIPYKRISVGG
ncbi:MAG: hypothetical protein J5783_03200 [Lachnospiraceae bacterium]|nr:hypothetical protein [Lachnospiraceae bacterium]